jgi:hypothetical protein
MKTIFQLAKLARRLPRKIRKAKQELHNAENLSEDHRKQALRRVLSLESQQRVVGIISERRKTAKPFRDATPHKKRKAPGDMQEPWVPAVPIKEAA